MADDVNPYSKFAPAPDGNPYAKFTGSSAPAPHDTEAPGPWPGVTSPESPPPSPERHSALGHIASAMGGAFKGPYGPSEQTLAPLTQGGVPIVNAINRAVIGPVGTALDAASRPVQAGIRGVGAAGSEIARSLGANPSTQTRLERDLNLGGDITAMLMGTAPLTKMPSSPKPGMIAKAGRINASDQAKQTIDAGFVLPPAEASKGHIGEVNLVNAAAGEAGKIKLGQLAAAKNQPLVNVYARSDLGLPPETVLSPEVFKAVREREGKVYQHVADAVPEIDLGRDAAFHDAASKVGARSEETERLFPSTKEPPGVAELRAEMLHNSRAPTQTVMDYIADLRRNATANFQKDGDAMAHRMGAAQRQAAHALEDAMERSVENAPEYYRDKVRDAQKYRDAVYRERADQGLPLSGQVVEGADAEVANWSEKLANANAKNQDNQTLLDRFRQARQTMAKSYDVESVTNVSTGDVSAAGLGKLLQQGRPLSDNLKLIADSANSFHRAFQNPASFGGVESYSVLDAAGAAAMALSGHPIAATMVGARPLIRSHVLNPRLQRRMISEPAVSQRPPLGAPLGRSAAVTGGAEDLNASANSRALGGRQ